MPQGVAVTPRAHESTLADLVFVGLNRRVIALDRFTGQEVWVWKSPKGTGFASVFLDGDRLLVGISGYVYCLDPVYGQRVWENPLKGYGHGLMSMASVNPILRVRGASKQFGGLLAVDAMDFDVAEHEVMGLIVPDLEVPRAVDRQDRAPQLPQRRPGIIGQEESHPRRRRLLVHDVRRGIEALRQRLL